MKKVNNIVVSNKEIENKSDLWLDPTEGFKYFSGSGWKNISSEKPVVWNESSSIDDLIEPGIYTLSNGVRVNEEDGLPINNTGEHAGIAFTLIVTSTIDNPNGNYHQIIGQTLILSNRQGGETKQYTRSKIYTINNATTPAEVTEDYWTPWGEYKRHINLNQISDAELKNCTENGMYEGVIVGATSDLNNITNVIENFLSTAQTSGGADDIPTGSLFTMNVLNNYAVVQKVEEWGFGVIPRSVTQRAKALLITGQYAEIQRTLQGDVWSGWKMINIMN